MPHPSRAAKIVSLLTSVGLAVGVLALAGSVLLPSTKRARFDFSERATTQPTTWPAASTTQPDVAADATIDRGTP